MNMISGSLRANQMRVMMASQSTSLMPYAQFYGTMPFRTFASKEKTAEVTSSVDSVRSSS